MINGVNDEGKDHVVKVEENNASYGKLETPWRRQAWEAGGVSSQ